jgi:hypothetical protein
VATQPPISTTIPGFGFSWVNTLKTRTGPDPAIVKDQLESLQMMLRVLGQEEFCKYFFWILIKKEPGKDQVPLPEGFWNRRLVPFMLNDVQRDMVNREKKRNICLKYRQGGYTTDKIIRRLYLPAITEPGSGCLLISQNHFYAAQHFAILKRTHRYFGTPNPYDWDASVVTREYHANLLHTVASNRRELVFDQLDSKILVDSAEQDEVGQGLTLNHLVCTEYARWPGNPEETLANAKEAIPDDGTLDIESTANGAGGTFYEECIRARDPQNKTSEFMYFFHPWWWHKEYSAEHVRNKLYRMSDLDVDFEQDPLTAEEKTLKDRVHLTLGQVGFRRIKKISLRYNFDEKYPEDDISAFLVSGRSYFDRDILRYRYVELQGYEPIVTKRDGQIKIFKRRVKGKKYVIGADTATGRQVATDDPDYSAAVVLDEETGEEVAAIRGRMPPEDFADDLIEMGVQYNMAMIAVERGTGGDGGVVLYRLEEQRYWNIYKHKDKFRARSVGMNQKKDQEVPGLPMTTKTRPVSLGLLRAFVEEYPERFYDFTFIEEAMRFTRRLKDGKPQGGGDDDNSKDDTVMCRAVAFFARHANLGNLDPEMLSEYSSYDRQEGENEAPGEAN